MILTTYKGFRVTQVIQLPELKCVLRSLVHEASGAEILHIENDDPENVFCLSFQTLPASSNGVAHILEHTVLCGSEKFPIKDPFFSMTRRSLNTFMNALTGADFTCYPAASQIPKDFYNLLDVYLDAVFHPNLKELSFKQEGHRLEFEVPDDPTTPLVYRGIVYNEMKGALNSGSARMHEALTHALYPNITYGVNSGGDPKEIPSLSYEELIAFHSTFYHPSRCLFFFCGNFELTGHLDFIEERILKNVKPAAPLPPIPLQPRFTEPQKIQKTYPIAKDESPLEKTLISFGWLTCPIVDQKTCLALSILEAILLDNDASPLKKALLQSGLCKHLSSYVDTEINEVSFNIHLRGCEPEKVEALEKVLIETLNSIVKSGFTKEAIENAIHQLEFHRSEITGDYYPFGLILFMRSGLLKQHSVAPEQGLLVHSLCDWIRKQVEANPHFFTELIQKYLLDNAHFVRLMLTPDPELNEKEAEEEKSRLAQIKKELTPEDQSKIIADAAALKAYQQALETQDIDVLPKIELTDIPITSRNYPLAEDTVGPLRIFHHNCFTNEIGYADIFYKLPPLSIDELKSLRLLTVVLHQMGCAGKSYEQVLYDIQAHTGGVFAYLNMHIQAQDHNRFYPTFAIRGKALYRKLKNLFPIMQEFLLYPDFSHKERLRVILRKHQSILESSFNHNALKYAINLSSSSLNAPSYLANVWYGLDYYQWIDHLSKDIDAHLDELSNAFKNLQAKILQAPSHDLVLSIDDEEYKTLKQHNYYGMTGMPSGKNAPWHFDAPQPKIDSQARIISSPVAFIGKVFNTISFVHPDSPLLNLAAFLFDNLTLHKKIREEGGAYGGGAVSNVLSGNFYFYSYRDPNIHSSLNAFEQAIQTVISGEFDEADLDEAKRELIQHLDSPISPGSRADVAYLWLLEGKTPEVRQAFRERVLTATCDDISAAVAKHILPAYDTGKVVVFANRDLIEKENAILMSEGKQALPIFSINE